MTDVVFSIQPRLFAVFRDADGSIHWSDYDGQKVKAAFPAPDGDRCIVLLDPDVTLKDRFENLFCVNREGKTLWIATLPRPIDVFVDAKMECDRLQAWSWSCYWLVIDPASGRIIEEEFTK